MIDLNKSELEITKKILNIGIKKSSDSLSFFTKSKVSINAFEIYLEANKSNYFKAVEDQPITVLSTKLKGDLSGECYLVFNEEDKEELLSICLPKSVLSNPENKKEMGDALLLELDNIVSASAITEFSNIFKKSVYGDVPCLDSLFSKELSEFIRVRDSDSVSFYLNVEMTTENHKISPQFIWTLGKDFIHALQKVAKEDSDNF